MLADTDDGQASSNGTSGAVSNGSRAQQRTPLAASANGTHKVAVAGSMNGSSSQNGKDEARRPAPPPPPQPPSSSSLLLPPATYFGHDRQEVTRILIQALSDMGYEEAAASVGRDSGFALESGTVTAFRRAVLGGDWAGAELLLVGAATAASDDKAPAQSPSDALILAPGADRDLMRFWLRQQKFLELLEQRDTGKALSVLRTELSPLNQDTQKLHLLSSLLMCRSPEDVKIKADWDGAYGQSRQLLLSELSRFISASVMLPEHRLAVLLQQVKEHQIGGCFFHTSATPPSLYSDHFCDKAKFPTEVMLELDRHAGEVWQVQFSHDGTRLASCGGDRHVIVWDVPSFDVVFKLDGHEGGVGNIAWSPDDKMLVSCGRDRNARIWDTQTGLIVKLLERFDEPVSCCVWAPDGKSFVLGSFDKERSLCQWNLAGEKIFTWTKKHRTEDLAISLDGHWLVAMDDQNHLHVYNFITRELEYEKHLKERPTSVSISQDSGYMLVNKQDGEIQLFNIATQGNAVRKYTGATGGLFLIRSSFGGADESFVVSGSEDGTLVIWHKNIGMQMFKLEAHKPRCNAVCWNPTDPCMFASCGDDHKIKIWSNKERIEMQGVRSIHSNGDNHSSNGWRPGLPDA